MNDHFIAFNFKPLKKYRATVVISIDGSWPIGISEVVMLPDNAVNQNLVKAGYLVEVEKEMLYCINDAVEFLREREDAN